VNRVVMLSAFRNSLKSHLDRYFRQASAYRDALKERGWEFRLALVEGDSLTPDTWNGIISRAQFHDLTCRLEIADHGGPEFGSVVSEERFKALSFVGNKMLSLVEPEDDIVVYVESDLIWRPETLLHLGSQSLELNLDIVSPLVFAGENFYDVWAFRGLDGSHFAPFKPYHSSLAVDFVTRGNRSGLTQLSSVGSCLVMKAWIARECRIIDNECLVGFCRDARNKGHRIWIDSRVSVNHP
jgi:hypothetical protein